MTTEHKRSRLIDIRVTEYQNPKHPEWTARPSKKCSHSHTQRSSRPMHENSLNPLAFPSSHKHILYEESRCNHNNASVTTCSTHNKTFAHDLSIGLERT